MKIADEAKPEGPVQSNEGSYTQEELDEMLDNFIAAKQIEADPKKLAMLKDYAISRQKVINDLFDVNKLAPPKSLKDLKKAYNDKVMADDGE